jgi:hypothetical protein
MVNFGRKLPKRKCDSAGKPHLLALQERVFTDWH